MMYLVQDRLKEVMVVWFLTSDGRLFDRMVPLEDRDLTSQRDAIVWYYKPFVIHYVQCYM